MREMRQRWRRWFFYASNILRQCYPDALYRSRLPDLLDQTDRLLEEPGYKERLDLCCRLQVPFEIPNESTTLGKLQPDGRHTYYYDFQSIARHFPGEKRVSCLFGDVTRVPEQPSFVKSRPIREDNANAVLLRLNQVRHFIFVKADQPYMSKRDGVVWRGRCGKNIKRSLLVQNFHDHPLCDIGDSGKGARGKAWGRPFMNLMEQLRYKMIISLEGIDVATNLKWIMSSQSLCVMPGQCQCPCRSVSGPASGATALIGSHAALFPALRTVVMTRPEHHSYGQEMMIMPSHGSHNPHSGNVGL